MVAVDNEDRYIQWRSKALRGPGSTVTWGPSLPSPPLPPPSPSHPPFPPLPSPALPLPRSGPQIQLRGLGAEPRPKSNLVHFSLKIRQLVATILMIFLRVLPKICLWPHYSGPQELGGPGSLNRLNLRFLRHWEGVIVCFDPLKCHILSRRTVVG